MIFQPWVAKLEALGCRFRSGHFVKDVETAPDGRVSAVVADTKHSGRQVGGALACCIVLCMIHHWCLRPHESEMALRALR